MLSKQNKNLTLLRRKASSRFSILSFWDTKLSPTYFRITLKYSCIENLFSLSFLALLSWLKSYLNFFLYLIESEKRLLHARSNLGTIWIFALTLFNCLVELSILENGSLINYICRVLDIQDHFWTDLTFIC